jgi:hypothetical protein
MQKMINQLRYLTLCHWCPNGKMECKLSSLNEPEIEELHGLFHAIYGNQLSPWELLVIEMMIKEIYLKSVSA